MRLWHEDLLEKLPRQQLLGQHRECCALRGNGWKRKHATINYIFHYSPFKLYQYHMLVIKEMHRRGYQNDQKWEQPEYRGKNVMLTIFWRKLNKQHLFIQSMIKNIWRNVKKI